MKEKSLFLYLFLITICTLFSFQIDINAEANARQDLIVTGFGLKGLIGFEVSEGPFSLKSSFDIRNFKVGEVQPRFTMWPEEIKLYYQMDEGYLRYSADKIIITGGYIFPDPDIGEKYPLFISPNSAAYPDIQIKWNPLPWFSFQNDILLIRSELADWNTNEFKQIPKSVYLRKFELSPLKDLKAGFIDCMLLVGRSLDFSYLFSPFPYQFMQEYRTFSAPWKELINDNGMMGLFIDYNPERFRVFAEILLDDFYIDIFNPFYSKNPQKVAWDTGFSYSFDEKNKISAEFAGATKFTFQRTSLSVPPYQYLRFEEDDEIPLEYNMIGYKYGENSGAVTIGYEFKEKTFSAGANFEFVIFGKRDPFTPWHGEDKPEGKGFIWLDEEVLQKEEVITFFGNWDFAEGWNVSALFGWAFIQDLNLEKGETANSPVFDISVSYHYSIQGL